MSENIAGYIDRSCIKGQIYKLAGCPKPVVAGNTVDIDVISSSLLSKAVYATNGQTAGGNYPNDGLDFLITTVEFGNGVYFQTAISITSNIEYNRIYSNGSWTNWQSAQSVASNAKSKADEAITKVGELATKINGYDTTIFSTDPASGSVLSIANAALSSASTANGIANNAKTIADNVLNMFSAFGTKMEIYSDSFTGTIGANTSTSDIRVVLNGYSSVIGVIPYTYSSGTGSIAAIPWIVTINQPNGDTPADFNYRILRPASNSAKYTDHITKFLVFGIAN